MRLIQQVELFYYVARYGGISRAIRHLPYGLSQPAVSKQVGLLEEQVGCILFERGPFLLTPEGERLHAYSRSFFEGLNQTLTGLRADAPRIVRVASTPLILREYFPDIVTPLRARFPDILFSFLEGAQVDIDQWFENRQADLMINVIEGRPQPGCHVQPLVTVPLVLLVLKDSKVRSLRDLLKFEGRTLHILVPPNHDAITRKFRTGLRRWPAGWVPLMQGTSLELISTYVQRGHGVGLSVQVPGRPLPEGVRAVPLPGFPKLRVGAVWRGPRDAIMQVILHELRKLVQRAVKAGEAPR